MIKANELRIGNLLNHEIFGIVEVVSIYKNSFDVSRDGKTKEWFTGSDTCNYITLTEEWLLKLGVAKQNCYPIKYLNGVLKMRNGVYFFKYHDLEVELPFVHNFQNLNFSLTNEELQLNTKP